MGFISEEFKENNGNFMLHFSINVTAYNGDYSGLKIHYIHRWVLMIAQRCFTITVIIKYIDIKTLTILNKCKGLLTVLSSHNFGL